MLSALQDYFASVGFIPHGYCMLWRVDLIALHLLSDAVIMVSYLSIPLAILKFVREREDVRYPDVAWLFAGFITACAATHFFGIVTLWVSAYTLQGLAKAVCAVVSGMTAFAVWRLLPEAIAMPGPSDLAEKNSALTAEVARRRDAEAELSSAHVALRKINVELEGRVEARTQELLQSNEALERINHELERANHELEQFAYVASHDMRTPLRAMITIPEWLRDNLRELYDGVDPRLEEDLVELELQSKRMDQLLTDLLTYARIGRTEELEETFDPRGQIDEQIKLSSLPAGFSVEVQEDLPKIRCVPTEFGLIIRNLISNAIKHHDRKCGKIAVRAREDGRFVTFEVADDGPGIPSRFAEKVFEMFSTLQSRDEVEGSGMGLAMVQKIVRRRGGRVRLVTTPDGTRGTTFEISLPKG